MSFQNPPIGPSPSAQSSNASGNGINHHLPQDALATAPANRLKLKGIVLQVFEHSSVEDLRAATAAISNTGATVSSNTAQSRTSSASSSRSGSPVSSSTTPGTSPESSPGRVAANALRTAKSSGQLRPDATAITLTGPRRNSNAVAAAYSLLSPYLLTPQVFLECEALLHATRVREVLASISMTLGRNHINSSHLFPNMSANSFSDWLTKSPQVKTVRRYTGLSYDRLKAVCAMMNSTMHAEISGDIHGATVEAAIRAVTYWGKHNKRNHEELREFLLWQLDVDRFEDVPAAALNAELKVYVASLNKKRPESSQYHGMVKRLNKTLRDQQIYQSPHIVHKAGFDKLSKDCGKLRKDLSATEEALQREQTARGNDTRAHTKQIAVLNANQKQHDGRVKDLQTTIHQQGVQLQNIKTDHAKEIQNIKTERDKDIQNNKSTYEREIRSLNSKLQNMKTEYDQEILNMKTDHDNEIQNMKTAHVSEIRSLKSKLQTMKTDHDKDIQNIKTDHDKEIQNIKDAHEREIGSLKSKLQTMKTDHDKEIQKMKTDHDKETQKMKTDHDKEIQKMKIDHDKEIQSLNAKFDKLQKEVRDRDLIIAARDKTIAERDQALAIRDAQLDALFKRLEITI
ncbi:hypothetical protein FN846DRAFT_905071 [Sphaerosporella brunnea]|uniref:Uncharacterized protein n=1 Tax=Sphaerosporella brunnea TaxID=1250544 RepID=A0A5J5F2E8_9PEZI|nr:hypothetical protein FN846DRAFT_905071 [Sphaerosporella brunnea]